MRIACAGGGPGGLFFAALLKTAAPDVDVTVFERNRAEDTFGFGVVFSDATLAAVDEADPVLRGALAEHGRHWDEIEVRLKGERIRCGGNGMSAISRKSLLAALQDRARRAGVDLRFETEVSLADLEGYDLVVAADGANSGIRSELAHAFQPAVRTATAKFIWFGTTYMFSGLTFVHERGPHGVFAVHGYPISRDVSTFIVETDEASWRAAGLDEFDVTQPPGPSDLRTKAYLQELFADQIDGHPLLVNNSRWGSFRTRRAATWRHGRVALLGDAAHTAHFSVGSGTKMAMEDAIALAQAVTVHRQDVEAALAAYEAAARPSVEKIQGAARPSLSWWEHFGRYHDAFEPWQFAVHFLTRAMDVGRLARRAPDFVASARDAWRARHGSTPLARVTVVTTDPATGEARARLAGTELPLLTGAPPSGRAWGLLIEGPAAEESLEEARAVLARRVAGRPDLVAVRGGQLLARTLLAEEARLVHRIPTLVVDDDLTAEQAETLVLSGRADLVGGSPEAVARWTAEQHRTAVP